MDLVDNLPGLLEGAALLDLGPLAEALWRASWQGALAAALVWTLCRLVPHLPAGLRCGLWWLVCLKLVVGLAWAVEVPVRALTPVPSPNPPPGPARPAHPGEGRLLPLLALEAARKPFSRVGMEDALLTLWGAGALLQFGLLLAQHRRLRGRVHRAAPVDDAVVRGLFAELRSALGVSAPVRLLASPEIRTPQVVGLLRPTVLLPAAAAGRLSPDELALTLGHELLHLRRRDLWFGWVPALAQRLFFFHPLAHLAAREYAVAREAACDAAVLRVLAPAPEVYGRLLLKLGVTPGLPRLAAAGGSPSYRTLKRRLTMLQNASQPRRVHPAVWCLVAVGAAAALVPFRMVAEDRAAAATEAAPAQPATAAIPTAAFQAAQRATPPTPPRPPKPPTPPTPPKQDVRIGGGGESWIAFLGDGHVAMNGSTRDIDRARQLLGGQEQGIWFERDGRSYVIRDAALTRQVEVLFKPQTDLGKQQAALGEQQAALGERQAKLGAETAQIGAKMAELGAQIASVAAKQVHGGDDEDKALDAKMEDLDHQMEELDRQMEKFEDPMEELGKQQEALGEKQEALGRQQEAAAEKAEGQLRQLLDKALADGTAQPAR